jgi:hypothetical protein
MEMQFGIVLPDKAAEMSDNEQLARFDFER